jgi:hypothetical protein
MDNAISQLSELLKGAKVTFSANCISGLVADCDCWRCRKSKGLETTPEIEEKAAIRSRIESRKFRDRTMAGIARVTGALR